METITKDNFQDFLKQCIIKSYNNNENIFDLVIHNLEEWYDGSAHSLMEIKSKESKKTKGTHFELLCQLYLKHSDKFKYENVWLLEEVPDNVKETLKLKTKDFGIDIVCKDLCGNYHAVQCKYRKVNRMKKNIITWAKLSTFYALCLRTGPWSKYIVMTNADYITHMGSKNNKDLSICIGTFKGISKDTWYKMANMIPDSLIEVQLPIKTKELTKDELREKRLKFLEKIT